MKPRFYLLIMLLAGYSLQAQVIRPLELKSWPESDTTKTYYSIGGYRHGISFFPKVKYSHVEYQPSASLNFNSYHSANVVYYWMEKWAEQYPQLIDVYEVGKSFEGRPIIQMTITNKNKGKATDKPAAFFEGNRHSGEVSSTESVMWLMKHLIESYGKDSLITSILDKDAIYLRPINNPDGHNLYMHTAQSNRSTVRPFDNDNDGLLDEDSPDDINGDGMILRMRYKDTLNGNYIIDPRDTTGRLMKYVKEVNGTFPNGKGTYNVIAEGIDNDGDGKINEDGIGGLDLHRNYAENWRPDKENTLRGWTQNGAGEYPLSETETRAVVMFLLENPNIYIVNSMDTRVPMHLRAPSTSASEERMYPQDSKWYKYFDEVGKKITSYERAGDVYKDYNDGSPLFGHGPDFGYWYYGAIWYGDEIWDGGKLKKDYNGDGEIDELDKLIWDDTENGGKSFNEWIEITHPTLGKVEIGGWDPKFYSQNSPSNQIEKWAKNQALFNLEMVKHLPELAWGDIEVKKVKTYKADSTDYQIKISYKNVGKLPTALQQAELVKIVRPDNIKLVFLKDTDKKCKLVEGDFKALNNGSYSKNTGYTQGGETNTSILKVRVYGGESINIKASVSTTRAGVLPEREFIIQ
ncbi:MAG: M14 family metallopeptidase [Bacteroidales bacterium]